MIDLHMHSSYSDDGEFTPIKLLEKCVQKKIKIMSITDHNCVKANKEVQAAAMEKGIIYIPGIEIDCVYKDSNFHVLGYGIDYQNSDFDTIEKNIKRQSLETSLRMLEKTQVLGFHVTENDMWNISKDCYWQETWTGEMFAELLLTKPEYANHPLLQPYRAGYARGDNPYTNFYWDFYSQGQLCYVGTNYPQMKQILDVIHQNHGFAVLAHPGVNLKGKLNLLEGIVKLGIDGIEAFSSYHTPSQAFNFFYNMRQYKLFATCGSDFHGKTKPSIEIGIHGCLISDREMQKQIGKITGLI